MRKLTYLLYFIYNVSLKTVHALSCETCTSKQLQICHSRTILCSDENDVCMNIVINVSSENFPFSSMLRRQCGRLSQCDLQGTLTSVNAKLNIATTCCSTNSCTPPLPTYSVPKENKNGRLCRSSYTSSESDNPAEYIMECTGNETQCVTYYDIIRSKYYNSYYKVSGCASKDFCVTDILFGQLRNSNVSALCTEAFPQNSLTPSAFQKCKFQHEKIKSKPSSDLCLPDEDVCLSEHMQVVDAGEVVGEEHLQRCGRTGQCDLFIMVSHPNKAIIMKTTCCQTQYCSPPTSNGSLMPGVENGLTCRSCYTPNSSECLSMDTMSCMGTMDRCVTYTATMRSGTSNRTEILIGCGTKDACTYGRSFVGSKTQNLEVNIRCSGRANTFSKAFVLVFVVFIISVE